ncbi:MAG: hypothetical protein AAB453_00860 [Patescibacteria group bacterium]
MERVFLALKKFEKRFKNSTFKILKVCLLMLIFSAFLAPQAESAINLKLNYQGKLTNASGVAVADLDYDMVFNLYTTATGGTAVWTESLTADANDVTVTDGLFSVLLGNVTSLSGVNFNQTLYLGVKVGTDSEMTPRKEIGSVPSAVVADTLDNLDSTAFGRTDTTSTFASGFLSTASSTITNLTMINSTTTSATTTNLNVVTLLTANAFSATGLSTLSGGILINNATSTITNLTMVNATTTNATTTNLYVSGQTILAGTSGNVGIATTSPWGQLSVEMGTINPSFVVANQGSSTPAFYIGGVNQNGNIGIGTSTPSESLTLIGGNFLQKEGTLKQTGSISLGGSASSTDVFVTSNYTYVIDSFYDNLKIFDTSTTTPSQIG